MILKYWRIFFRDFYSYNSSRLHYHTTLRYPQTWYSSRCLGNVCITSAIYGRRERNIGDRRRRIYLVFVCSHIRYKIRCRASDSPWTILRNDAVLLVPTSLCFFAFLSVRDTHICDVSTTNAHSIAFLTISTVTFYRAVLRFHSLKHYLVTFPGNSCPFSLFCFFFYEYFTWKRKSCTVYFRRCFLNFIENWISRECFLRVYILIRYIEVSLAINNVPVYRLFTTSRR